MFIGIKYWNGLWVMGLYIDCVVFRFEVYFGRSDY